MKDIEILKQLLDGNHLEKNDLNKASNLLFKLGLEIDRRRQTQ